MATCQTVGARHRPAGPVGRALIGLGPVQGPRNAHVSVIDGAAKELLDSVRKGYVLVPTLAFIDPFGFKGISMDTICRLTSYPKCEVVFSFMYDGLNRWVTHPDESIHVSLRDLFGTDRYEDASTHSSSRSRSTLKYTSVESGLAWPSTAEIVGNGTLARSIRDAALWRSRRVDCGRISRARRRFSC